MQLGLSRQACTRVLNLYLIGIAGVTFIYGLLYTRIGRNWSITDWLINYQGGFIRRGLMGELAYVLDKLCHISPLVWVLFFAYVLYGLIFLSIRVLAMRSSWNLWVLALLFSPATLSFQVLEFGNGFRKELVYLAALAMLLVILQNSRRSSAFIAVYLTIAGATATLSHESLICFTPYFAAALIVSGRSARQGARECAIPLLVVMACAFLSARHLGDGQTAARICSSIGYSVMPENNQICSGGAIKYLGYTPAMARDEARLYIEQHHYLSFYPTLAALALAPAIGCSVALYCAGMRKQVVLLWMASILSGLCSLILFLYAVDWGRWIYIHAMSLTMLLLFLDARSRVVAAPKAARRKMATLRKITSFLLLAGYCTLWTLPHVAMDEPRFGYPGIVKYWVWHFKGHIRRQQQRSEFPHVLSYGDPRLT